LRSGPPLRTWLGLARGLRQEDPERRPSAGIGVDADVAAVALYDAHDRRETQPPAGELGREERVEDPLERAAVHPAAGVGHLEVDELLIVLGRFVAAAGSGAKPDGAGSIA